MPFNGHAVAEKAVFLDGRFYVEGASMRTARVTVTRDNVSMRVLANDPRVLSLRVDLQEVYILTFEREGCRSKSVLFDTRMSEEAADRAPYTFRFDVTLHKAREQEERYAGPVAYVRFSDANSDFIYDLDYRLTHDTQGRDLAESPSGEAVSAVSTARARGERHFVQPFVDPTMAMLRGEEQSASAPLRGSSSTGCGSPLIAAPGGGITSVQASVEPHYKLKDQRRSVIVEQEREITIVRVKEGGFPADYRQIRHSNGTVLHYRNGSSCTYEEFVEAVGNL